MGIFMLYFYLKINSDLSKHAQVAANLDSVPSFVTNWLFGFKSPNPSKPLFFHMNVVVLIPSPS